MNAIYFPITGFLFLLFFLLGCYSVKKGLLIKFICDNPIAQWQDLFAVCHFKSESTKPDYKNMLSVVISKKGQKDAWVIFILSALFCAYEFVLRIKLSPLSAQMLSELKVSAHAFGILSSSFFLGYAPVQLLSGPIIQQYGPRKILLFAIILCSLSTFLFALSHQLMVLFLLRLLVGIGSGFAFIGAYMLIANWFPMNRWAFMYGLLQFTCCTAAMYGQKLIAISSVNMDWRELSHLMALIGVSLTILFYFYLQNQPENQNSSRPANVGRLLTQLKTVALNSKSYPIAFYAFFSWGPITFSATLWGPAFLAAKLNISIISATNLFSYVWLGVAIGSPIIGYLSTTVKNQKQFMIYCSIIGLFACSILLRQPIYAYSYYKLALFLLGLATTAQPISFVKIQQANPPNCRGTAIGFNNTAVILSGVFLQPLSSYLVERSSHITNSNTLSHHYQVGDYLSGMMLMPFCFLISLLISIYFIKENTPELSQSFALLESSKRE